MRRQGYYSNMSKYMYPFYILLHPADGFREMKVNKKCSMSFANGVLVLWVLFGILDWGYVDFDFRVSYRQLEGKVNIFQVLLTSVVIFAISVVSNWCFCTLMDGKGRLKEIWVAGAYAMMPYVLLGILRVGLTHTMVSGEAVYLTYLDAIGLIWSALLVFIGLMEIHDYSGPKTLVSLFLTLCGVLIIAFLVVLVSGLATQIYSFFATIFYELKLRYL
ncbi:MAG: YIP1 family protein [Lachnospiraceae bacterium]|nr:YIP1 family protein [Lachnospiraceae bacterium]